MLYTKNGISYLLLFNRFKLSALILLVTFSFQKGMAQNKFFESIKFNTTVTGDFVNNFKGGLKKGLTYIGKEDLTIALNTGTAGLWKNGNFFIHGLNTHGQGPSENYTGDLQVLSNIEAGDHTGLFEFWYSHKFGKFTALVGQHDLNTEFLGSKYSSILVNSSFGIMPSLSLNMSIPIFPLASPGVVLKYETDNNFTYKAAVYDGSPGNFKNNRYNLRLKISSTEGFFSIGEIQYKQKDGDHETGEFKIGTYYHTGYFPNYADTTTQVKGNTGIYFLADKMLFPRSLHAGRGLCMFLQGGLTNETKNMIHYYIGGGLSYHGLLPDRFDDQLAIGIAHISISNDYKENTDETLASETSIETTYIFHIGSKYHIQPGMQYIIQPGVNKKIDNALVGLLRFSLSF